MGLFDKLRARSKSKSRGRKESKSSTLPYRPAGPDRRSYLISKLPVKVLASIFEYVCPHCRDLTYTEFERSELYESECCNCEYRDLAACVTVCRRWRQVGEPLLYRSIRVDMQHFCGLEDDLKAARKHAARGRRGKYIEVVDLPKVTLQKLCETLRANHQLAQQVLMLKIADMARGDNQTMAMIVSSTPNLQVVDLSSDVYYASPNSVVLRKELQSRCRDLRKMVYWGGAEEELDFVSNGGWPRLEVLELRDVKITPNELPDLVSRLSALKDLRMDKMDLELKPTFGDARRWGRIALTTLTLIEMPNLYGEYIANLLRDQPLLKQSLKSLVIENAPHVEVFDLHKILAEAPALQVLSLSNSVTEPMKEFGPFPQEKLMRSASLKALSFNITDPAHHANSKRRVYVLDEYYDYLASSLSSRCLPALTTLYVRERQFIDRVSHLGREPVFAPGASLGAQPTWNQNLEIFAKGDDELDWSVESMTAPAVANRSPMRPISTHSAVAFSPPWALSDARRSVLIGSGKGDFISLPSEERSSRYIPGDVLAGITDDQGNLLPPPGFGDRPGSSHKDKRASRGDLWR